MKNKVTLFWLLLLEIPFVYLAYQYLVFDSLAVYDASGHLAAVWYLKTYLWPALSGWNSLTLLGIDQGLFYPPLFHYLAASLSLIFSVELATKILVTISILALPLAVYLFSKIFFREVKARVFTTSAILLVIFVTPGYLGANIKGLVQIGLLPSFASLPLVFLYLWSILKPKHNFVLSSFLLALVLLTHIVAGVFCSLFLIALVAAKTINKQFAPDFLKHLVISLLLSCFFLVPFLINFNLISTSVHVGSLLGPNFLIAVFSLGFVYRFWKKKQVNLLAVSLISLCLSGALVVDSIVVSNYQANFLFDKIYNLHLYRYQTYLFSLATLLLVFYPTYFLFSFLKKPKIKPELIVALPTLFLIVFGLLRSPFLVKTASVEIKNDTSEGRFLETFNREDSFPFVYTPQNKLVMDKQKPWAYGLFTDATPNGPYIGSLIRTFDPFASPEQESNFIERTKIDQKKVTQALNLFGISTLLFLNPDQPVIDKGISVLAVPTKENALVEASPLPIEVVRDNWDKKVKAWWLKDGSFDNLLVYDPDNKLGEFSREPKPTTIKNFTANKNFTKFSFEIDSEEKLPVLIKLTNLPNWQAKAGGEEIEIFQASPALMLVNASGKVEFSYKTAWYQKLTLAISLTTFLLLIYYLLRRAWARRKYV